MANTVQMNLNVRPVTKELVGRIADLTHRGKGDVIDLAIEKLWGEVVVSTETVTSDSVVNPRPALYPPDTL